MNQEYRIPVRVILGICFTFAMNNSLDDNLLAYAQKSLHSIKRKFIIFIIMNKIHNKLLFRIQESYCKSILVPKNNYFLKPQGGKGIL